MWLPLERVSVARVATPPTSVAVPMLVVPMLVALTSCSSAKGATSRCGAVPPAKPRGTAPASRPH